MSAEKDLVPRDRTEMVGLADLDALFEDPEFLGHLEDAACRSDVISGLTDIRCAMELSQKKVAKAMGTTQSAVSELEGGATDPRLSTLQRYARAVGASLHIGLMVPNELSWQFTAPENRYVVSVNVTDVTALVPDEGWAISELGDVQLFGRYKVSEQEPIESERELPASL